MMLLSIVHYRDIAWDPSSNFLLLCSILQSGLYTFSAKCSFIPQFIYASFPTFAFSLFHINFFPSGFCLFILVFFLVISILNNLFIVIFKNETHSQLDIYSL